MALRFAPHWKYPFPGLRECYRLDATEIGKIGGLTEHLEAWVRGNLQQGGGIAPRYHSLQDRVAEYERGWKWVGERKVNCDHLEPADVYCIRNIAGWFRQQQSFQVVELGFNKDWEMAKVGLAVPLPSRHVLFMAIAIDRGLKTFYVNTRFKGPKRGGYRCAVPGCKYILAGNVVFQ